MRQHNKGGRQMRFGKTACACACALIALAAVGTAAATASVKPTKKTVAAKTHTAKAKAKKTAAKKPGAVTKTKPGAAAAPTQPEPMCQLGQATIQMGATPPVKCTPNPLFAKDVCDGYQSQAQSLIQGTTIATAGNRYGPLVNSVSCYYTVDAMPQAIYFTVEGGANFHTNSLADTKKQIDLQQAFEQEYQQWAMVTNLCTVKTTVEGFEAFTVDNCPTTSNGVTETAGGRVEVLAGDTWVMVGARPAYGVTSSSQLIPFAEQLIAKYRSGG
jgi:hypothetical protein